MVRQVGLHVQGQEEVDLLLALELGRHLSSSDGLLLLRAAVDLGGHLQKNINQEIESSTWL